jgi:ubiquinone/menaquinone biosynthesis C-methylase UbiE
MPKTYYDEIAPGYDRLHGAEQHRKYDAISGLLQLPADARVLDVGCGTGIAARAFGRQQLTGIDAAERLLRKTPFPAVLGRAEALPFKDKAFEAVLCVSALHNFTDPAKALDEMRRVASGHAAITLLRRAGQAPALRQLIEERFHVAAEVADPLDDILICH